MIPQISKQEALQQFELLVKKGEPFNNYQWDKLYDSILLYPKESQTILEILNQDLYLEKFKYFFELFYNDYKKFQVYEFIPQIINHLGKTQFDILEKQDKYSEIIHLTKKHIKIKFATTFKSSKLICELSAGLSYISLSSIYPLKGIILSGANVPYYSNPNVNGYTRQPSGILREKGFETMNKMISNIWSITDMIYSHPSYVIGLYNYIMEKRKHKQKELETIRLTMISDDNDSKMVEWFKEKVEEKFKITALNGCDLFVSVHRIVRRHPELFNKNLN